MGRTVIPQVYPRGHLGWYAADLRKWGGGRPTLRDPSHAGWPKRGDRTEREDEAVRWALVYVDRILEKRYRKRTGQPEESLTLGQAIDRYEIHRERLVEQNTRSADGTALGHLRVFIGDTVPLHRIETDKLQEWFDARVRQGYKLSTLDRYRVSMGTFFDWAGGHNPADHVVLAKSDERDARAWSDAELRKIRKAADEVGPEHRRFFELGIATGARYSELLALEWGDFSAKRHTVRFTRQAVNEGTRRTKGLKGDRNRTALVLDTWWKWHEPRRTGRIVCVKRPLGKVLEAAGIKEPEISNHAMRHTYARICRERYHIPISILRKYLGHENEATTEKYYGWMGSDVALNYGHRQVYGR